MSNDAKKVSELGIATTLSANDRVVILSNPDTSANVKTITTNNFFASLGQMNVNGNIIPTSNNVYTLGNNTNRWASLWIGSNTGIRYSDNTTQTTAYTVTSNTFNPNFTTNTGNVLVGMTQSGNYTKFGKICYFRTNIDFSNVSSFVDGTGQYQIVLPFPSVTSIAIRGGTLHNTNTATIYAISGMVDITGNTSILNLYYRGTTTDLAWKNTTPVSWFSGNSSHFDISGVYETV